ncbi:hypothetical protein WUBG_11347, partial [Wuchereria bancrofti]
MYENSIRDTEGPKPQWKSLKTLHSKSFKNTVTLRSHVDDAIDTGDFIRASEQAMRQYTVYCENAIRNNEPQQMVDNTSQIARFGNRVLMTAKNEADNSEEPSFVHRVNNAAQQLHSAIPPMVNQAKQVALNPVMV